MASSAGDRERAWLEGGLGRGRWMGSLEPGPRAFRLAVAGRRSGG